MRWQAAWALVLGATACDHPCETLAERICVQTRASDPVCQRLRAIAASPTALDRQTCDAANALANDLQKH